MPTYYCLSCGRPTRHLDVAKAASFTQVTRTTVYNWLSRRLVHFVVRPSGRKFICESSLVLPSSRPDTPSVSSAKPHAGRPAGL